MTDRTDHRDEAERLLADAREWSRQAGDLGCVSPRASERACLARAAVHALLAIHDTLTAADRYATNEAKQRAGFPPVFHGPAERLLPALPAPLAFAPDPLDEDDHRDRMDRDGNIYVRHGHAHWHSGRDVSEPCPYPAICNASLRYLDAKYGPLAFAPEPPQEATGGDLSASEGESGAEERDDDDDTQKAILCPECGDHINTHNVEGCRYTLCDCPRTPEDVTRALISDAVKAERLKLAEELRGLDDKTLTHCGPATVSRVIRGLAGLWEQR